MPREESKARVRLLISSRGEQRYFLPHPPTPPLGSALSTSHPCSSHSPDMLHGLHVYIGINYIVYLTLRSLCRKQLVLVMNIIQFLQFLLGAFDARRTHS